MKKGPVILVSVFIAFCFSLVMLFRASSQLASASVIESLIEEVVDTHDTILSLRAKKEALCSKIGGKFEYERKDEILEICGEPLSPTIE